MCLTIKKDNAGTGWMCSTCYTSDYTISQGKCINCKANSSFGEALALVTTPVTYTYGVESCAAGATETDYAVPTCTSKTYFVDADATPDRCKTCNTYMTGCAECSSKIVCTKAKAGYFISNNLPVLCSS